MATVKAELGNENETAQGIEEPTNGMASLSVADSSTEGQQSVEQKTEPDVKQEASSPQAENTTQVNSSDDSESRDAKFKKYLKDLDCKIREILRQSPLSPNQLEKLDNHLKKIKAIQIKPNKEQSDQKQQQYKEQFNQLVLLLQPFCSPPEVWNWEAWQQMSSQEQIKQTEQLKQLVDKYVVAVKYLIGEETFCQKLKSLKLDHSNKFKTSESITVPYKNYVTQYWGRKKILFLGINPNQRGMELGGVPFCDDQYFINWLGKSEDSDAFDQLPDGSCGKKFWGLVRDVCGTPDVFFKNCFVRNYCPFPVLGDEKRKNYVSLSDMKVADRQFEPRCDEALRECVRALGVGIVVAVGDYVAKRATQVLNGSVQVVQILHPSRHNSTLEDDEDWKKKAKDALGEDILNIMNQSYTTPQNAPAK